MRYVVRYVIIDGGDLIRMCRCDARNRIDDTRERRGRIIGLSIAIDRSFRKKYGDRCVSIDQTLVKVGQT